MPKGHPIIKTNSKGEVVTSPIEFNNRLKQKYKFQGKVFINNAGTKMFVEDYQDEHHVRIRFLDDYGYSMNAMAFNIIKGNVKNPYDRNMYGGYIGVGPYTVVEDPKRYKIWSGVLKRANAHLDHECYYNTSVSEDWLCFQNFADWYVKYKALLNKEFDNEYQLDKDIIQWNQKYKVYSSNTCCLIPAKLNSMLDGLHRESTKNLPTGVVENGPRYTAYVSDYGKRYSVGTFDTPEEASIAYRNGKKEVLAKTAKYYYDNNAITEDIYIYYRILNLDII